MEKVYEKYKESCIDWIGQIPENWEVSMYKFLSNVQNGFAFKSNLFDKNEGFPIIRIRDITSGETSTFYKGEYSNEYIVENDDLLVGMDGDFNVRWWEKGKALLNQRCCRIINNSDVSKRFLFYALPFNLKIINDLTYYTTVKHLSSGDILNAHLPSPPFKEQTQIAAYLDYHTDLIDQLILKKEALIKALDEQRQAIINEAVTKGLNPDVAMKDSEIEWLGEIPEHWEVIKLFHLSKNIGSGTTPKSDKGEYYDGDIGWLNTGDLNDGFVKNASKNITEKALKDYSVLKLYPVNSVVIALYGATIGKLAIIGDEMTTNQACCVLNPNDKLNYKFLFYLLLASRPYLLSLSYGGGQPNISQEIIKQLRVSLPEINEQEQIIEVLEKRLDSIEISTDKLKSSIEKLIEYRQSLISEVVTGKIDVRDWKPPK